jgi:hypothetical protein
MFSNSPNTQRQQEPSHFADILRKSNNEFRFDAINRGSGALMRDASHNEDASLFSSAVPAHAEAPSPAFRQVLG